MIDPKELRIGNAVSLALLDGSLRKDTSLNVMQFIGIAQRNLLADPIPLTKEWLFKFGFYKQEENNEKWETYRKDIESDWFYLEFYEETVELIFDDSDNGATSVLPHDNIRYVHQLQNLFFALTGEELTVKQPVESQN